MTNEYEGKKDDEQNRERDRRHEQKEEMTPVYQHLAVHREYLSVYLVLCLSLTLAHFRFDAFGNIVRRRYTMNRSSRSFSDDERIPMETGENREKREIASRNRWIVSCGSFHRRHFIAHFLGARL